MRHRNIRATASAVVWISAIELISSFAVKQIYNYNLSFTPYFLIAGILGLLCLFIVRFV